MEQTPSDTSNRNEDADFHFYPTNKVVGITDDPSDTKAALHDLRAAGFAADDIDVLTGEEGAHRLDVSGEEHGLLARIARSLQKFEDFEREHIKRLEQELLAGHYSVGVTALKPEAREKVCEILKSHNGHFINYYGKWTVEVLER